MSRLPATGRLRIASAGAHHNVLVFAILLLLWRTGFGNWMLAIGYEEVSRLGKVVISIDDVRRGRPTSKPSHGLLLQDSPLNGHIVPGDTITALNDFALGSNLHQDLWFQYFLEPNTIPASHSTGWCVGAEWFQGSYVILTGGRSLLTTPKPNQAPAAPVIHHTQAALHVFHHRSVRPRISTVALTLYP